MDHLSEAKDKLELAEEDWETGHDPRANRRVQAAAVHALIALVEQLDSLAGPSIRGDELRQYLRVTIIPGTGLPRDGDRPF